jgi:hypothetical protein
VGTDKEGRAFLDTVFRGVLGEFSKPTVNDRLFSVALAASDNLSKKDTLVYMFDPELQSVVARSGWDGSLGRPEGDRIAVVDSNVGWSKVDRNIERSFVYDVTLRPSGPMSARLTLSYQNLSGPESGACDAQSPLHGLSYAELRQSCYWNLVRVYIPDGGSMTASLSLPIPEKSVYARVGAGLPGDDSVQIGAGPGGKYISGLLTVAPGETANARFDLLVPATALVADGDMLTYRLALTAQAGALGRDGLIRLELPPGYELAGSSRSPTLVEANAVEFALTTETDVTIEVQMRPGFATGGSGPSASYTDIREPDLQSAVPS